MQPNNTTTQQAPQYTPTTGVGTQSGGFTYTAGGWTPSQPPAPTAPTTNPVINTQQLTGNTQQPQLPTPAPQTNPSSFVNQTNVAGSMPPAQPAPTQPGVQPVQNLNTQFGDNKGVYNRIQGLYNQLTGKSGRQVQLEQQANIPQVNKEIADLTEQLATKKAAFDQAAVDITGKPIGIERQTGKIAQIQRNEAVTIGGLSALLQAKQGNLANARTEIDRTLKLEFEPIETQITALKDFYTMNQNDLTESEKLRMQEQISNRQKEKDFFYDIKKAAYNEAIASGSNDALSSIISAQTPADVSKAVLLFKAEGSGVPKETREKIAKDATAIKTNAGIGFVVSLINYKNTYKKYADEGRLLTPEARTQLNTLRGNLEQAYSVANGQGAIQAGDRESYSKIIAGGITFPQLRIKQMDTLANATLGSVNNNIQFLNSAYGGYATPFFSNQLEGVNAALAGTNPAANLTGADFFGSILNNSGTSTIFNPQTGFVIPGTSTQ